MKEKLHRLMNKMLAFKLILASDDWFLSAQDVKSDQTRIIHGEVSLKTLNTTYVYIDSATRELRVKATSNEL